MNVPEPTQAAPSTAAQVLDTPGAPTQASPIPGAFKTPPAAAPTQERISPQLQVIIKREKMAVERERAAAAKEAAATAREQAFAAREAKVQEFENLKATNPRKALELLGLSYQELTQAELADGQIPPEVQIRRLEDKFNSSLKAQEEAVRQSQEQAQKQEQERLAARTESFKSEISEYVKKNSDRYELIGFEESDDLVYEVIDEHYNRTYAAAIKKAENAGEDTSDILGEVMTIAQAADKVEEHLEKKYDRARNLNKMKAFLAPRPGPRPPATKQQPSLFSQTPQTFSLNNQLSASPTAPRNAIRTDEDRKAAAIAYAQSLRPRV